MERPRGDEWKRGQALVTIRERVALGLATSSSNPASGYQGLWFLMVRSALIAWSLLMVHWLQSNGGLQRHG